MISFGEGAAGMGGVMRNEKGEVKVTFSKSIGEADANFVEMPAIKKAFTILVASKVYVLRIEKLKKRVSKWEIKHFLRSANQLADELAKKGVCREFDLYNVLH
ncbi:Uncharacterized protein TCM_017684 [Theobroma cacao]|uniref:RNase H type-1 domain-containing protein n=1 Tax=Theobroma cacao TaxID=3641 RepID=A0A061ELF5_THECC|nr:Uncharacterized protein TCM_017684 [Theobroma cacao]